MQVKLEDEDNDDYQRLPGFVGGSFLGTKSDSKNGSSVGKSCPMNHGHLAMTYFALATLTILGDDFSRVDQKGIARAIKKLQRPDGSFEATGFGTESGMRFLYCACAVSYMLNDWSGVDMDMAKDYIRKCTTYDGAMGLHPGQESHGGSTYCAVAALALMGEQNSFLKSDDRYFKLVRWCIHRQKSGFQGRRNKVPDTCYSFWVGATLKMLDAFDFVDTKACCAFHKTCEFRFGGFCKFPESRYPDPLHTYFSICALSMMKTKGFKALEPMLCISNRASKRGVWNRVDDDFGGAEQV